MTNYEIQGESDELTDSFMDHVDYHGGEWTIDGEYFAEHVSQNVTHNGESDATDNITGDSVTHDSREKLEADVRRMFDNAHVPIDPAEKIIGLLDRQAAITERDVRTYLNTERSALIQSKIDKLTAENINLANQLGECMAEREQYRDLFAEALCKADEIAKLQP